MKTILLVDDNENFRIMLKEFIKMENNNFKFIESDNPLDALETFYMHDKEIDIVLCDFFMPVQNGNDFLEIVKKNKPSTKCLLVSGDSQIRKTKYIFVDIAFSKLDLNELVAYLKNIEHAF